jgi:phospholipid/cholesterol/gamma-HCH transport system substrate-binding protein
VTRTIIKLGAFVLVCLAFTAWLALTIGNIHPFQKGYTLTATFDDVTGLLPNDNVKVAGVVVGKVRSIGIDKGRAKVTFTVKRDVEVPEDSVAAVRWRNLLGQRYVYIYPGTSWSFLGGNDEITETKSVIDLGEVFNRLGPIVAALDPAKVNDFLDAMTTALDGNEEKVGQILDDFGTLAKGLGSRDESIGSLVEDLDTMTATLARRDEQIRTVLDNLVALASTFSDSTDVVDRAITDLGSVSDSVATLLANHRADIDTSLADLVVILDTVKAKLGPLDPALAKLDDAAQAIYRSGSYGEWLNQTILCAATGPPPAGSPCATPITKDANMDAIRALLGVKP